MGVGAILTQLLDDFISDFEIQRSAAILCVSKRPFMNSFNCIWNEWTHKIIPKQIYIGHTFHVQYIYINSIPLKKKNTYCTIMNSFLYSLLYAIPFHKDPSISWAWKQISCRIQDNTIQSWETNEPLMFCELQSSIIITLIHMIWDAKKQFLLTSDLFDCQINHCISLFYSKSNLEIHH